MFKDFIKNFKLLFNSIIKWCKNNIGLVIMMIFIVFTVNKSCNKMDLYDNLFEKYNSQSDHYKQQIEELKKLHQKEVEARKKEYDKYYKELEKLRQEYDAKLKKIEENKEDRQQEIVDDFNKDPNSLTSLLEKTFGIPVE